MKKYYLSFNSDSKMVKFYFKNDDKNNFNFLLFLCVIFGLIIICLLGYLIYFKKLNLKKKKRANELEDEYDYVPNIDSNLKKNKEQLFTKLI